VTPTCDGSSSAPGSSGSATDNYAISSVAPERRRRSYGALSVRNFRLYFGGQILSTAGSWAQIIGTSWLVLRLTGSGTALGLVGALQALPVLLFAPFGGMLADRFPKRKVLVAAECVSATNALVLGVLVATDRVELWMVYVLGWVLGCATAVDLPTRQTFVVEMVESRHVTSAVSMNSVVANIARVLGPAIAALVISTGGLAACFFVNSGSYVLFLVVLAFIDPKRLHTSAAPPRAPKQLREGFAYVRRTPTLFVSLLMLAVIGTLAYEMQVILPLVARFTFDGDASTYSLMVVAMGAGAIVAGMVVAAGGNRSPRALGRAAMTYGVLICVAAAAPNLAAALVALVFVGAASIVLVSYGNATLQLAAAPEMRGRVMALWTVAIVGSTPIGGPIVGWIGEHAGPRWGLALGGVASVLAGALAYSHLCAIEDQHASDPELEPDLGVVVVESTPEAS
jgi:MFS family permease